MRKIVFFLSFFLGLKSQETDGSILTNFETQELSQSDLLQMQKNVESGEFDTNAEIIPIDVSPTQTSSSFGLFNQYSELDSVNSELNSQNTVLSSGIEELQSQISDLTKKIGQYSGFYQSNSKAYKDKIQDLDAYNRDLLKEKLKTPETISSITEKNKLHKEKEDDDKQTHVTTIIVAGIGLVFLIMQGVTSVFANNLNKTFKPSLFALYEDVAVLLLIASVGCLIFYVDPFEDIEYEDILSGVAVFTLIWLGTGTLLILICYGFAIRWKNCENQIWEIEDVLRNADLIDFSLRRLVRYYVMRKLFINSLYLPYNFNLKSLDFSAYLSKVFAKELKELFKLSWPGYTFVMFSIVSWRLLVLGDYDNEFEIFSSFSFFCLLISCILFIKLVKVHNKLSPNLSGIDFQTINPDNNATTPMPEYLQGEIPPLSDLNQSVFGISIHPLKLTFGYILQRFVPSRHDLLFWLDVYGIGFLRGLLQGLTVSMCLWVTLQILYYLPRHEDEISDSILTSFSFLAFGLFIIFFLPNCLRLLTIVSSIEMKKNKEIVKEVLVAKKIATSELIIRIYRQMKMIYRDKFLENKHQDLNETVEKLIEETFEVYGAEKIEIYQLEEILAMFGISLNDDELRLFAKECVHLGSGNEEIQSIHKENFKKAVSVIIKSKVFNPRLLVKRLLHSYFREYLGKNLSDVTLDNLQVFFKEFSWHFNEEDSEDFIFEVKEHSIKDLPGIIQDSVECSYK